MSAINKFNLTQYDVATELTSHREDTYPVVIAIEALFPAEYRGRAKTSI